MEFLKMTVTLSDDTMAVMKEEKRDPINALSYEVDLYYMVETYLGYVTAEAIAWYYASSLVDTKRLIGIILDFLQSNYSIESSQVSIQVEPFLLKDTPAGFREWMQDLEANGVYAPLREAPTPKKKQERRKMELTEQMKEARLGIQSLVGADDFKALCDELLTVAAEIKENETAACLLHQTYLFSINDGCGYTTALAHLKELFMSLGVCKMGTYGTPIELKLSAVSTLLPDPFSSIYETLSEGSENLIQILSIDIREWISTASQAEFKDFLLRVSKAKGFIIVFRVPFVDKEVLTALRAVLNDVLFVRCITFPPLAQREIRQIATAEIEKNGFRITPAALPIFDRKMAEEKSDGRFYGINTIHKVVWELLYQKQLTSARRGEKNRQIGKNDVKKICSQNAKEETAQEMLASLVGAEHIEKRINEIISQIVTARRSSLKTPCIHMRFVGNPGTGKTTVARIIGQLLKEKGVLRVGSFFEYAGRDLVGRYIGETAPRTAGICRDAYGSVLFIDEAYSLYRGPDDQRDFGREALDTLVAEMENHRSDLMVIMAGYTDDMATMMKGNAGLASRMPYTIEFPNFTRDELYRIFESMVKRDFSCEQELLYAAKEYFENLPDSVINAKEFANGRFVRNLYERVWAKAALRSQMENAPDVILKKIDFELSTKDGEFNVMNQKKKKPIGFMP